MKLLKSKCSVSLLSVAVLALICPVTMQAAEEWYDGDNDGVPDTIELPEFIVDGNDPATFDWDGFFDWCEFEEISDWDEIDSLLGFDDVETGGGGSSSTSTVDTTYQQTATGGCLV